MSPLLAVLVLLAAAALAVIWRSWTRATEPLNSHRLAYVNSSAARVAAQAVHRLHSPSDDAFIAAAAPEFARRLRANRRRALHLYLRQMRADFRNATRVARDAAAHQDTPDAGLAIARLTVEFYSLQAALYVQSVFGVRLVNPAVLLPRLSGLEQLA